MTATMILLNRSSTNATPPHLQFGQLSLTSVSGITKLWVGDANGVVTQIASTDAFNSTNLTGTPTAPTPLTTDNSIAIATTAFVKNAISQNVAPRDNTSIIINTSNQLAIQAYGGTSSKIVPVKLDTLGVGIGIDGTQIIKDSNLNLTIGTIDCGTYN